MNKDRIEADAGTICHLLAFNGELSVTDLRKYSDIPATFLFLALGWLLRDDKIRFIETKGAVYVVLHG
ncbi:MAG: winged helix-turn-helix domain-containing protein [Tannerella sp.]|jgi:hypothetical protein|nr:winged helix-turn-helix domain-containing protein [Tannerella sp.]